VKIRSWPEHEAVVVKQDVAVIALARDLPEPVADLARLLGTRSRSPYKLANSDPDLPGRFWATG